jgi:hypothetical protein
MRTRRISAGMGDVSALPELPRRTKVVVAIQVIREHRGYKLILRFVEPV